MGGREGGREGGMEGGRKGEREGGRGEMEWGREKEKGWKGEGGRCPHSSTHLFAVQLQNSHAHQSTHTVIVQLQTPVERHPVGEVQYMYTCTVQLVCPHKDSDSGHGTVVFA